EPGNPQWTLVPAESHLSVYMLHFQFLNPVHSEPFQLGMASVFVMNATSFNLQYDQKGSSKRGQPVSWETAPCWT
uniref:Uncharacterized protein n=1 Tax=Panagrolaimus sp. ES5 TaxID=591445 RepID=A0AC34GAI7_9BILA